MGGHQYQHADCKSAYRRDAGLHGRGKVAQGNGLAAHQRHQETKKLNTSQFLFGDHWKVGASAKRMRGLLGKFVGGKDFSIKGATNRTGSFIAHRHPFQLFNSDLCIELFSSHAVSAKNLGAGDHLHTVLGLAEHLCPRLLERVLVYHHLSKVPDDVIGSFSLDDGLHDDPLDAVCEFAVDVTGESEVVLRHEVEGIGVDDGEHLGGQLIDAFGLEVGVERQRRVGELSDSLLDAELDGVLGRLAKDQGP
jgi:hypothetical protein